jgi:threonine synthase
LILATNRNDILSRFVNTGVYQIGDVYSTITPSMDIQLASNFERYLFYLMDQDAAAIRVLMDDMARQGRLSAPEHKRRQVTELFSAVAVGEQETLACIKSTYEHSGYILDPHTAVGVKAADDFPRAVCLATADPAKFDEAVYQAIGRHAAAPPSLQGLMEKETRCTVLDANEAAVKQFMCDTLAKT